MLLIRNGNETRLSGAAKHGYRFSADRDGCDRAPDPARSHQTLDPAETAPKPLVVLSSDSDMLQATQAYRGDKVIVGTDAMPVGLTETVIAGVSWRVICKR